MYCTNCGNGMDPHAEICIRCGFRMFTTQQHCYHCGVSVHAEQEICVSCGVNLLKKAYKNTVIKGLPAGMEPAFTAVMSFLLPGVGQILNKQVTKGVVMLVFYGLTLLTSILIIPILFSLGIWVISIIDAWLIAQKIQKGQSVGEWEFF